MPENTETVKEQILAAAKEVFKKWGLHKSTMEDIAKAAGKGKSTLYYYYKNKEDILDEAARIEMDYCFRLAQKAIVNINSAKEKLRVYVSTIFRELKTRSDFYGVLIQEVREDSKLIAKLITYYDDIEAQHIKEIINFGVSKKEFTFANKNDQARATFIIALMLRNLQTEFAVYHRIDDLTPYTDMVTNILLNGISA